MSRLIFRSRFINWQTDPDLVLQPSGKQNAPEGCNAEPAYKNKNHRKHFKKNRSRRRGQKIYGELLFSGNIIGPEP